VTHLRRIDVQGLENLRFVNKRWSSCVAQQMTRIKLEEIEKEDLPDFLAALKKTFVNIQALVVPVVWMDDEGCQLLASVFPELTSLEVFWGDSISDEGFRALSRLPLRSLKIYHSRLITDEGIGMLKKTPLEELWVYGGNQITDEGFRQLRDLHTLKELKLMYCNALTRRGLEPLFHKDGLKIFVRFCRRISSEISIS